MNTAENKTPPFVWTRKHLLSLESLSAEELEFLLDSAQSFREVSTRSIKKVPALRGRVVVNAFFEDSTRTRTSFSLAASRLSADVIDFSEHGSSVSKGETLIDTARNIEAMGVDVIVLRHRAAGAAEVLSRAVRSSVINAGDGAHEHPTQGLLDLFTIRERFGKIAGLKVAIVGDIVNAAGVTPGPAGRVSMVLAVPFPAAANPSESSNGETVSSGTGLPGACTAFTVSNAAIIPGSIGVCFVGLSQVVGESNNVWVNVQ